MFLNSFNISASALSAQRLRLDVIANNIANADTTRTADGGPYRRQFTIFAARGSIEHPLGVRVLAVREDPSPFRMVYDPEHPDAGEDGYVRMPNVNSIREMIDLMEATRAYEANVTALEEGKKMILAALEISR